MAVVPYVDGVDLRAAILEYELSNGFDPAGGYEGIAPDLFDYGDLFEYYVGAPDHTYWGKVGKIALLGCECGEVGCWPLYTAVRVDGATVTWTDFEQPHRPAREYSRFGPYAFRRVEYEDAVSDLKMRLTDA